MERNVSWKLLVVVGISTKSIEAWKAVVEFNGKIDWKFRFLCGIWRSILCFVAIRCWECVIFACVSLGGGGFVLFWSCWVLVRFGSWFEWEWLWVSKDLSSWGWGDWSVVSLAKFSGFGYWWMRLRWCVCFVNDWFRWGWNFVVVHDIDVVFDFFRCVFRCLLVICMWIVWCSVFSLFVAIFARWLCDVVMFLIFCLFIFLRLCGDEWLGCGEWVEMKVVF